MRTEEYIPKRVKELCSKHKVSKYRLAQLTDMSQTALANIMNKKSIPTVPTLERICDAFGISIAQFFAGDGMLITGTRRYKNDGNKVNQGSVMIQN